MDSNTSTSFDIHIEPTIIGRRDKDRVVRITNNMKKGFHDRPTSVHQVHVFWLQVDRGGNGKLANGIIEGSY
jgi:hypothetical protein